MLHPSALLAYAAWLAPLLLPFLLAYLWRSRVPRKAPFVLIGGLCALGVVTFSMFFLAFLLAWLNKALGMSLHGPIYGGVPMLVWFNGVFMLAFNLALSLFTLTVLSRTLSRRDLKPVLHKSSPNEG